MRHHFPLRSDGFNGREDGLASLRRTIAITVRREMPAKGCGMRCGLAAFVFALAGAGGALAHHPGSHATREPDGRVRVEAVATVGDSCLVFGAIRTGTPPAVLPPPGATPVTAYVERKAATGCISTATAIRGEGLLAIGTDVRQIHLYIVGPDGALIGTERVPLRKIK
jgi:hypothetical protein